MKRARIRVAEQIREVTVEGEVLVDGQGEEFAADAADWLPPAHNIIYGLALNFADHAKELDFKNMPEHPIPFVKNPSSVVGHRHPVFRPDNVKYMHYEGELGVVIGTPARKVKRDQAMQHVAGYTITNDFTVRDFVENFYRPPVKAKGFDSFGPMGPWIVDAADVQDPHALEISTYVNGELRQQGTTADLIFDIPALIEWFSAFMTLRAGDVISTGTPIGLSDVVPGDEVAVEVAEVGRLENRIISEAEYDALYLNV